MSFSTILFTNAGYITALCASTAIASLAVTASAQAQGMANYQFLDAANHWAASCIEGMGEEGLMKGYLNGSFQPDGTMTRAEFAAVIVKAFPDAPKVKDAPDFLDVAPDFWGKKAISAAYERGFLAGYPGRLFKPAQTISRAQAIVIIANAQGFSAAGEREAILTRYFEDKDEIPGYAREAIAAATLQRRVVNYPAVKRLRPNANITRGEAAALLCRTSAKATGGADARYYVPADYVAAFNQGSTVGSTENLAADQKINPVLLQEFSQQSDWGLLYTYAPLGNRLFFSADDGLHGDELWATDGTPTGTQLVLDAAPGIDASGQPNSSAPQFVSFSDQRFWFATAQRQSPNELGNSLWSSDGTAEGTRTIASISPALSQALGSADSLTADPTFLLHGKLPFTLRTSADTQLWLTDGESAAGTQRLATFTQSPGVLRDAIKTFTATDQHLFFSAYAAADPAELWRSDGTPAGTFSLKAIAPNRDEPVAWQDHIYFGLAAPDTEWELWASDGTPTGTGMLKDIYPGSGSSSPTLATGLGSSFLFLATAPEGFGLWATQGTPESTRLIKQMGAGRAQPLKDAFVAHNDKLFIGVAASKSTELGAGNEISSDVSELWITDGTEAGTQRLKTFSQGHLEGMTIFKDRLFFSGGGEHGQELWVSDGTPQGTHQVIDLSPGTATFLPPCAPPPPEFDTSAYCQPEVSISSSSPRSLTVQGGFLYFITSSNELFRTDGTSRGIQRVEPLKNKVGDYLPVIVPLNETLLFTQYNSQNGRPQLWALPK